MLDGIKAFVKGVINRMFPAKNVEQALKIETCISSMMQTRIELWQRMYSGMAPWCKGYRTYLPPGRTDGITGRKNEGSKS